jgi:hypothetical protein
MTYIPNDWWIICQKTGIKFRVSEMREEPNKDDPNSGRWVHQSVYDPVQPQEYVKGVEDDTSVPLSYPDNTQVAGETTLLDNMDGHSTRVFVVTLSISEGDPIGIIQNDGTAYWSFAAEVETLTGSPLRDSNGDLVKDANGDVVTTADPYSGYLVTLGSQIHSAADMGNVVYLPALNNEEWQ